MELDSLSYDYTGNQLDVVNDLVEATDISNDFEDNDSFLSQGEYGYDNNGNMFWDENKSIDNISYNHLNLPEIIDIIGKGRISYLYDVAGNKLRMEVFDESNNLLKKLSYIGSFVYDMQNELDYIISDEGRILPDGNNFKYEYNLKDHLGNTRLVFEENNSVPVILQNAAYYPFGMEIEGLSSNNTDPENRFMYNGKELQDDLDLNWHDYGARFYDAQLGRFHTQDAYAEKYVFMSPYQYAANNPINLIDVNGDSIWFSTQYNDKNELVGITMNVTGKIIDMSGNGVDMNHALGEIKNMVESSYKGSTSDGVSFKTNFNFSVAKTLDDVKDNDHLIVLSEFNYYVEDDFPGVTNEMGGMVSFVDADYFTGPYDKYFGEEGERTSAHEVGHWFALHHQTDPNNLMTQGKARNRGNKINGEQLKTIHDNRGLLNSGGAVNKSTGLPNEGAAKPYMTLRQIWKRQKKRSIPIIPKGY
ncbi:MAG: hypothetical protein DRJ10_04200 [Bacteroidetes bacterium]|nr:MAG: hypothetical protein DRJ10_04200 [Bacteroidota bacterium]